MVAAIESHKIRDWIGLSLAHSIGPATFFHLVKCFGSPTKVLQASASALKTTAGLKPEHLAALADRDRLRRWAERELSALTRIGGRALICDSDEYPDQLRRISQPPPVIYVQGRTELLKAVCVAVVGSRAATSYGRRVSYKIARDLALSKVCVVSGLALGIDGEAHAGCLSADGETIGVLGCGLDVVYPRRNRQLFDQIRSRGLLVSEYPLGTQPEPFRFPARNRIIAGLSRGVLVVEASRKSGSLITVQFGLEEGREIFAVPGQVDSAKSSGTHWLVQQGATLVVTVDDILEQLSLTGTSGPPEKVADGDGRLHRDPDMAALLAIIDPYPQPRELLLQRSGLPPARVNEMLLTLELEGLVELVPGDEIKRVTSQ